MAWTKRQIIIQAFEEIGIALYAYDMPPEELMSVLNRLNGLMAAWDAKGIHLGFPTPASYDTDSLDADSNLPGYALEAVYANLAIRIAPKFGKVVSVDTKAAARAGFNTLMALAAAPIESALPTTLPVGSGARRGSYRNPFVIQAEVPITVGDDSTLDFD